ncbi:phospholipase A2 [Nonomuraea insulae]|uniref:Phospholipase A2 n=1 Tax=Nonomuraea insulae TaxID=1616787 RepID=A0ABW1CD94_9ACTN
MVGEAHDGESSLVEGDGFPDPAFEPNALLVQAEVPGPLAETFGEGKVVPFEREPCDVDLLDQSCGKRWNFNWNTNGCSAPSFTPKVSTWNILFAGPCARHDFGYRNVKPLSGKDWKKKYKKRTDQSFLKDMQRICDGLSGVKKVTCKAVAATYFTVVDDWAS